MWWWLSWGDQGPQRSPSRAPEEVVCATLMMELDGQCKEAERAQRERESHFQRLRSGVDYTWLKVTPRSTFSLSTGERLGLEELCCQVPTSYCGLVIIRLREAVQVEEPEVQEVPGLFRSVLLNTLEQVRDEREAQRLAQQWSSHKRSISLVNFRSRLRINPFSNGSTMGLTAATGDDEGAGLSDLKTVSGDVERGQRAWSEPDFKHSGTVG